MDTNLTVETMSKEDRERQMYGLTAQEMIEDFNMWNIPGDAAMMQMRAMGILSDVQEGLSRGVLSDEDVRQGLNRAKYFMSEVKRQLPR